MVSLVSAAGRERNVDGVLMWWLKMCVKNWIPFACEAEVYLIDVDSGKVYRAKGATKKTTQLVDKVLAAFVEGRGEKLDIASISAEQAPAQAQEKTRSTPYRIGLFPFDFGQSSTSAAMLEDEAADALQTFVDGHPALVLAYSYFDRMLNEPRLRKVHKLWAGGAVRKKPVVSLVSAAGRERNIDGVLVCRIDVSFSFWGSADASGSIEVYLIDVDTRKVYRAEGARKKTTQLVDKVVSQFLDDHAKVVP